MMGSYYFDSLAINILSILGNKKYTQSMNNFNIIKQKQGFHFAEKRTG